MCLNMRLYVAALQYCTIPSIECLSMSGFVFIYVWIYLNLYCGQGYAVALWTG